MRPACASTTQNHAESPLGSRGTRFAIPHSGELFREHQERDCHGSAGFGGEATSLGEHMSFPVRIKGTGRILGQVTLPGHSLESRSASPPSADGAIRTTTSRHPLVPGESLAELRRIYDDVRESLGGAYSKLAEPRQLAITDGGLLAFADARTGAIG